MFEPSRLAQQCLQDAYACLIPTELEFVDNGCSGATLIRPALELLRDVAAAGGIDQRYVHCPDQLLRASSRA